MRMTSIQHQREIDADQMRQFAEERADQEREAEEANSAYLFNIPADVWFRQWRNLSDPRIANYAAYFWLGVLVSTTPGDPEFSDRHLLATIARRRMSAQS